MEGTGALRKLWAVEGARDEKWRLCDLSRKYSQLKEREVRKMRRTQREGPRSSRWNERNPTLSNLSPALIPGTEIQAWGLSLAHGAGHWWRQEHDWMLYKRRWEGAKREALCVWKGKEADPLGRRPSCKG